MKKILSAIICVIIMQSLIAQPQPQQPPTLPKHEINKPVVKVKTFPSLSQYIYEGAWKGDMVWATADAGYSVGIRELSFSLIGETIWQLSIQEIVSPRPGSFNVAGKGINFSFNYSPYKYNFKGVYNDKLGNITGTFTLVKLKMLNAPAGYTPGTISGTFTLTKK